MKFCRHCLTDCIYRITYFLRVRIKIAGDFQTIKAFFTAALHNWNTNVYPFFVITLPGTPTGNVPKVLIIRGVTLQIGMTANLISGIVFSEFDVVIGPKGQAYLPDDLDAETLKTVATITIDIFVNTETVSPSLLLVPFPTINKTGLVWPMQWEDARKRGRTATGSLTILFEEKGNSIYYRYSKDFEELFTSCVTHITELRLNNAPPESLQEELENFHTRVVALLDQLTAQEMQLQGSLEAFPEVTGTFGETPEYSFKVIVVGDPSVGKSSLILRYTDTPFTKSYIPTIGVNITEKYVQYNDFKIQLMFWDLAGQTKFQKMRHQFYQGAEGVILVYDRTNRETFESIPKWFKDIKDSTKNAENIYFLLCGNKTDLPENVQVPNEDGRALANELDVPFFETSALTGEHVEEAIGALMGQLLELNDSI